MAICFLEQNKKVIMFLNKSVCVNLFFVKIASRKWHETSHYISINFSPIKYLFLSEKSDTKKYFTVNIIIILWLQNTQNIVHESCGLLFLILYGAFFFFFGRLDIPWSPSTFIVFVWECFSAF